MQTSAREHAGHVYAKKLDVGEVGGLKVGGAKTGPVQGGQLSVTGTATVTFAGNSVVSAVAAIGQAPAAGDQFVTATWSGNTITLSVWTSVDVASTTATVVNWIALGT